MSEKSTIEWTEATWNPVLGCTHVSEGCEHCYAARETSGRLSKHPLYAGLAKDGKFTGEVRLVPERLEDPLRWRRPRMVFVNSMSDLFHADVPDEFIADVFAVMGQAGQHTFQVLTKRPGRMASLLSKERWHRMLQERMWAAQTHLFAGPVFPNVWLGTSVETQKWADVRIPKLLETPAAVRFLSCEPLLGPVDLAGWLGTPCGICAGSGLVRDPTSASGQAQCRCWRRGGRDEGVDWVIVGGESGPGARPMHPDWARSLRDQCVAARVPFFFKQWGRWYPAVFNNGEGDICWPDPERDRSVDPFGDKTYMVSNLVPKHHHWGRLLDGRTWDEMPERAS